MTGTTVKISVIAIFCLGIFGCATTSSGRLTSRLEPAARYIDVESFCKQQGLDYSFDTIDDILHLYYSNSKEITLLVNSGVGVFNGSSFSLAYPVRYYRGQIFIPSQLTDVIAGKKIIPFKAYFNIRTIVIDPGHGGKDPGAISPWGLQEKNLNLIIARSLKDELENKGFKAILTRSKDIYLSLRERVEIAKRNNADLFISIHANSNRSRRISGAEIYYLSFSRLNSSERSIELARTQSFQGKTIPLDAKAILWDLLLTRNYSLSVEMSQQIYSAFREVGLKVKPPKKAPFYVLRLAYVPSVLVETGYLTNIYDEKALRKKYYQRQITQALAQAVVGLSKRYTGLSYDKAGAAKRTDIR